MFLIYFIDRCSYDMVLILKAALNFECLNMLTLYPTNNFLFIYLKENFNFLRFDRQLLISMSPKLLKMLVEHKGNKTRKLNFKIYFKMLFV